MSEESTFTKTYNIPEENLFQLNRRLSMIATRAKKLGFPPIEWKDVGREFKKAKGREIVVHTIEVSGVQPRLSGWGFQGKLEQLEGGGTLVHSTNDSIPKKFWDCKPECEHCNTKRDRRQTFILKNVDTNEFKQVGGSCLKDFFNDDDPQQAASYLELFLRISDHLSDLDEDGYTPGSGAPGYVPVGLVLTLAAASIRRDGFMSAKRAEELTCMSTGQFVAFNLLGNPSKKETIECLPCDRAKALEVEQWLLSEYFDEQSTESSYAHNLRSLALLGGVPDKRIPLMASAVVAYDRHKIEAARITEVSKSVHVGTVDDKVVDMEVRKKFATVIPGDIWGGKTLYVFEDKTGNEFKWFSSGKDICIPDNETVHLSGTIKKHSVYRDVAQTELTRVKVTETELFMHINNNNQSLPENKPAQKLMKRPLNIDVRFEGYDMTFLDVATLYNPSYIQPLLTLGVNPCAQDLEGSTAAHRAVWSGNIESIDLLKELAPDSFDVENLQRETASSLMQEENRVTLS